MFDLEALVAELQSGDAPRREYAAECLGRSGCDAAVEPLTQTLDRLELPRDYLLAIEIVGSLCRLKASAAAPSAVRLLVRLPPVLERLKEDPIDDIASLGNEDVVPNLEELFEERNWSEYANELARAMSKLNPTRAVKFLSSYLQTRKKHLRNAAVITLGQLGWQPVAVEVRKLARSKDGATRRAALAAMAALGDEQFIPALVSEMKGCEATADRLELLATMRDGPRDSAPLLARWAAKPPWFITSDFVDVELETLGVAAQLGNKLSAERLESVAASADEGIARRGTALAILLENGDASSWRTLLQLLRDNPADSKAFAQVFAEERMAKALVRHALRDRSALIDIADLFYHMGRDEYGHGDRTASIAGGMCRYLTGTETYAQYDAWKSHRASFRRARE